MRFRDHNNICLTKNLKLHFTYHGNTIIFNNICKYLEHWWVSECCSEEDSNVDAKTDSLIYHNDHSN